MMPALYNCISKEATHVARTKWVNLKDSIDDFFSFIGEAAFPAPNGR